jgi:predicted ester cyclase
MSSPQMTRMFGRFYACAAAATKTVQTTKALRAGDRLRRNRLLVIGDSFLRVAAWDSRCCQIPSGCCSSPGLLNDRGRRMNAEAWNTGNLETPDDFFSPDVVQIFLPDGSEIKGLDQLRAQIRRHREAFPDWAEEIRRIVAGEDLVAIHFVSTGTNERSFRGNPRSGSKSTSINRCWTS